MTTLRLATALFCTLSLSACAMGVDAPEGDADGAEATAESADSLKSVLAIADIPSSTVTDGSHVYFAAFAASGSEYLYRVPVGGGTKQSLTACSGCGKLAVDGSYLYFNNGAAVFRIPKAGGTKTKLAASSVEQFADMALDSSYLYFAGPDGVKRVAKGGGSVKLLSKGVNQVRGLALDSSYVYWVNIGGSGLGTIRRVAKAGGSATTLLSATSPYDLVVDGSCLYWTSLQGLIWRSAKNGRDPWFIASGQASPTDLAANGTHLFWTNSPGTGYGSVKRMAKTGGSVSTLASGQSGPESVTVSGSAAYWANYSGDQVMKATF